MTVLKFGGTSLASAKMINQALDISIDQLNDSADNSIVLVASAMGKTTDALQNIGDYAAAGNEQAATDELLTLKGSHFTALVDLVEVPLYEDGRKALDSIFAELEKLVEGLWLIREASPRSQDTLLSFGERLSTTIIYYRALQQGIHTRLLDSRELIKTAERRLLAEASEQAICSQILPEPRLLYVAQGFIASDEQGFISTLGRGGSDYSATIIGAALNAGEVQIWTDVNGIMTSDPRIIKNTHTIEELSYEEAAELSYFGAQIIHPAALQPAIEKRIPVLVKNTSNPNGPGSLIHADSGPQGIRGIIGKRNITLINIQSSHMLNAYGFLRRIFAVFEKWHISVDLIATSEISVSLTIEKNGAGAERARQELEAFAAVTVETEMAIVCLVGKDLWKKTSLTAQVFNTLADIPLRMISLGSADINLSIVLPQGHLDSALQLLHDSLFPSTGGR